MMEHDPNHDMMHGIVAIPHITKYCISLRGVVYTDDAMIELSLIFPAIKLRRILKSFYICRMHEETIDINDCNVCLLEGVDVVTGTTIKVFKMIDTL
jgi:hypothetical protein